MDFTNGAFHLHCRCSWFLNATTTTADATTSVEQHGVQAAAWTTNRNLLVASRAKGFPRRPTNFGSTQVRSSHVDGDVIGCYQCVASSTDVLRYLPTCDQPPLSRIHTIYFLHPCPHHSSYLRLTSHMHQL